MLLFFAGVVLSLVGSFPPGIISLSVAQASVLRGFWAALLLAAGAAAAEFFQALGAVLFADWFLDHPVAALGFEIAAVPVFLGLAVHLWFFAKAPEIPAEVPPLAPARQFFRGVVVSLFNLLAIPYWVAYAGWLHLNGWWKSGSGSTVLFCAGVSVGTMSALLLYAWSARTLMRRSDKAARVANRVAALIFLGLGLKLALKIVGDV